MNRTLAYVLLSGGIDSSTALKFAIRDHGRENVLAVSVNYGQRHQKELQQAAKVAEYCSVRHTVVEIAGIPKAGLTDHNADIPNVSYSELTGVSPTYVPFRNGQLLAKLAGIAQADVEALRKVAETEYLHGQGDNSQYVPDIFGEIYFGAHAEDAAGDAYPDCRFDFVGAMGAAIYIGTYHAVRVRAPLIEMNKSEIVLKGEELGVPWHLTWSCYKGEALHCGVCPTCRARHAGFLKAKVEDPTVYSS